MAKRMRYYYDEESCTFQEEKVTLRLVIGKYFPYMIIACLIAFSFLYDDPGKLLLKSQNQKLKSDLQLLGQSLALLETEVDDLHSQDNKLYRSILGTEQISTANWDGGTGGALKRTDEPAEVKNTRQRLEKLLHKVDRQNESYNLLNEMFANNEDRLRHIPAIKPVPGGVISGFGMRMHPIKKIRKKHTGLDLEAKTGTQIRSAGDGFVKLTGVSRGGYGNQIEIQHGEYGFVTKYAHLSKILVKKGQKVKRGDVIGLSGNTGLSKGPHLHYEIIRDGRKIDPIDYFYGNQTEEEIMKLREAAKRVNTAMD
ncbi:MAG: M23 family metallopeptidase [Bacteroidota bacterium]